MQLKRRIHVLFYFLLKRYPYISYVFKWFVITSFISIAIGSASAIFLISLSWVTEFRESHFPIIFFLPLAGLLIGFLYHKFGKDANQGNNLIINAIHKPEKRVPFIMAPLIFISTIITHLFGGSAGREGSAIQMAGSIGDIFRKPLHLTKEDNQILLIAATSAGFGSIFGTPLAGAIFGLEFFLIGKLRYNALFPAVLASIMADLVCRGWGITHMDNVAISYIPSLNLKNILYTIFAGVIFGLCARVFCQMLKKGTNLFNKKLKYPLFRPFIGGIIIIICVLLIGNTDYIGLGLPMIADSFNIKVVPYAFILKLLLTIITLCSGFKGGEVTPLFFIGATLGNALALFIPLPFALLAGMGFVAIFSGATNTPLASSVMAIEIFGSQCGVYVFIACIVSYLVSGQVSIYRKQKIGEPKFPQYSIYKGKDIDEVDK